MNYDLVICGVGGQGVLSIAWAVDHAAFQAGFHIKQPEVHGMAQRGGAVSALVRIADAPIASDLIPTAPRRWCSRWSRWRRCATRRSCIRTGGS